MCIFYGDCPFNTMDCEEDNGHYRCKYRVTDMADFEIYDGKPIYGDKDVGAVLLEDELWHPFRYFESGNLDIGDDGFTKPSSAYKVAKLTYT